MCAQAQSVTCASQAPEVPSHDHMHLILGSAVCIRLCALCQHGKLCLHNACRQHSLIQCYLCLLTDAAIVMKKLHVYGGSLVCLLFCVADGS